MSDCSSWNFICWTISGTTKQVHETVITAWGQGVLDGLDKSLFSLGTFWAKIPTPKIWGESSATAWARTETGWIQLALLTGSLIFAGSWLAWTRRGEDLRKIVEGLVRVILMSLVGIAMLSLLMDLSDQASEDILADAIGEANGNFATKLLTLSTLDFTQTSVIVVIVLGLVGVLANLFQLVMMLVRSAMLALCFATLPMAAAAAITDWGANWLKKMVGWTVSFIMMKPAAALIYAVAIKLVEGKTYDITEGNEIMSLIIGVTLMVLAAFSLPSLVSFIVPVTSSMSGGGGAAVAAGAGLAATGAMMVQRSGGKGSGSAPTGKSSVSKPSQAPTGAQESAAPTGKSSASKPSGEGAADAAGASKASGASGAAGGGGAAGAAGSAGSAGAAAATGGMAAAAQVAAQAVQGASSAVQSATDEATGAQETSR